MHEYTKIYTHFFSWWVLNPFFTEATSTCFMAEDMRRMPALNQLTKSDQRSSQKMNAYQMYTVASAGQEAGLLHMYGRSCKIGKIWPYLIGCCSWNLSVLSSVS